MKARLVQKIEGVGLDVVEVDLENAEAAFGIRGFEFVGVNINPSQRSELQGAPKFAGLYGPMYDGPGFIRYECPKANEALSC
jgi:hypothetical protein